MAISRRHATIVNVAPGSYIHIMASAGIRDLKNNLSRYIRRLEPGEVIEVTDRGRVVAELRSPTGESARRVPLPGRYAELVAAGIIRPAAASGDPLSDWPTKRQIALPVGTVTRLIDEDRGA